LERIHPGQARLVGLTAILDIDGTLVDTNYQHALAWYRAFRAQDIVISLHRIHRSIGMGGDQLVAALAGEEFEDEHGDDARAAEAEHYAALIDEVQPLPGARALIDRLVDDGHAVVLASSAKEDEVDHYLDLLDVRDRVTGWTSSTDVETTKPAPDLVHAALKIGGDSAEGAVMVGDSTYDCEAAQRAQVEAVAVLTGGFSREELREAGAATVFWSPEDLLGRIEETPFAPTSGP
jgi:HAD superfamily hydrolase (TIGR01509 family)